MEKTVYVAVLVGGDFEQDCKVFTTKNKLFDFLEWRHQWDEKDRDRVINEWEEIYNYRYDDPYDDISTILIKTTVD